MRPSPFLRSGGGEEVGKYGKYLGGWGNLGSPPQKGVTTYALSVNAQRPLAGTLHAAIFNTWRRFSHQVLFFAPPMIAGYLIMGWAIERNEYLNSKPGRLEHGEDD
ncbi:MAG: hypothetical protein M1818_006433 [Claussenomyces sp. TS43310]|nr:MAG: hypothetical protein M1818_006433 [Claussenomyces sp. TS43310]